MGYIVKDGSVQKAHKVSLSTKQKNKVLKPTARQIAIREKVLKRRKTILVETA